MSTPEFKPFPPLCTPTILEAATQHHIVLFWAFVFGTRFTDTVHVPFLLEFAEEEAVIVTVPGETAETRPELFTVAIDVLPLLQVTPCGAPEGETVADSCFVLPALTVALDGLTVTPVGAVTFIPNT